MSITESIERKKKIQESLLEFLEEEINMEENYENFVRIINDQKILGDKYELKSLIQMINKISANHQRIFNFIDKIEQILKFLKTDILLHYLRS